MNEEIVLNAEKIYKRFGGILALNGVSFELKKGEVHALMGENGAGKSTLAKIFAGIETPDDGAIFVKQKAVRFQSISDALEEGISIVLQEFNLIPHLSVAENLFLNHEKMTKWNLFLNRKVMIDETNKLLDLFDMRNNIDPMTPINELSVAEMQIIEILKAVSINSEIIILDEPTAALSNSEVTRLFEIIRDLKDKGVSFIIVSHRFNEIFEISDRITVLRDGNLIVHGENIKNMTEQKLVKSMVGREIKDLFGDRGQRQKFTNKPLLEVQEIIDSTGYLKEISFSVHKGEVLGIAGLVGSGRTELVNCIFGADKPQKGKIMIDGKQVKLGNPKDAIRKGISLVPEDRKNYGLILSMSVRLNLLMSDLAVSNKLLLDEKNEIIQSYQLIKKLKIKVDDHEQRVYALSGGNQQKVLLGKWLQTRPKVLIVDEPTRGIDILAKSEIYRLLNQLAEQGISIIMVSSELPELIGMCDRVLVMRDGRLVKELHKNELTEENILSYASFS